MSIGIGRERNGGRDPTAGRAELRRRGSFLLAGGVLANGIARWDGATWNALGTGAGGSTPSCEHAGASADGRLVAAADSRAWGTERGTHRGVNGTACRRLAMGRNLEVRSLVQTAAGDIVAGGNSSPPGCIGKPGARWMARRGGRWMRESATRTTSSTHWSLCRMANPRGWDV